MGFDWEIKFIDIYAEDFGVTDSDKKVVYMYTKDRDNQTIMETLLHELHHVVLFDLSQAIFHLESERDMDKEENLVRLSSPRLFSLIVDNKDFFNWFLDNL